MGDYVLYKEVMVVDMAMGIARSSMELASQRVATETQTAMLKKAMDFQEENMALLLKSMGMGQNLSVQA